MKLTARRDPAGNVAFVNDDYDWATTDTPLKREATVSTDYADISGPRNWLNFGPVLGLSDVYGRD